MYLIVIISFILLNKNGYALFNNFNTRLINTKTNMFNNDESNKIAGVDQRNINVDTVSLKRLIYIHDRYQTYMRICNKNIGLPVREQMAIDYLNENKTMQIDLLSGGLMDDWDFSII